MIDATKLQKLSVLERDFFLALMAEDKFPEPEIEYRFHPVRRWRFDFAYPDKKIAIELEGGVYTRGRHTRGSGFEGDCEKYNAAAVLGWKVVRFTRKKVDNLEFLPILEELFKKC